MTPDIEDLMVCHEIAHALWTPLDMLEQAQARKINHSFVNIIEDARIESKVQERYRGSVAVFNRGYRDLTKNDFFGLNDRDVSELNLIDRINLFFKKQKVEFSDEEKIWVKKVSECKTPDDVLNLSEELYTWMKDNTPEEKSDGNSSDDLTENSDENLDMNSDTSSSESSEEGEEELAASNSGSADDDQEADDEKTKETGDGETGDGETEETEESGDTNKATAGNGSDGDGEIEASTDTDINNAIEKLIDKDANNRVYGNIPNISGDDVIIKYNDIIDIATENYSNELNSAYFIQTKKEVVDMKADSKKTVAYMVKEFEMKKSADQYARASTSKTGSLDMSALHTYKFNDDLFKKVTTLPGATNHGMVMIVDWSGSMAENLEGTFSQLFSLVWFCRQTHIPFEVYAFSDAYPKCNKNDLDKFDDVSGMKINNFKSGNIILRDMNLLNIFSSKMNIKEEMEMMYNCLVLAKQWTWPRNNREGNFPIRIPSKINLGGTPLNEAIIAMMDIVPKFKTDNGVQKVNTVFLTDGVSNSLQGVYTYKLNKTTGEHSKSSKHINNHWSGETTMFTDPKTNKTYEAEDNKNITNVLIKILKDRIENMNVVGFFIAGRGKSGRVDKRTLMSILPKDSYSSIIEKVKFLNKEKYLSISQCGYDEYYILPGGNSLMLENDGLDDDLVGASKAKLKSAFGKSMKSKISSRQLLNKFVKMVA